MSTMHKDDAIRELDKLREVIQSAHGFMVHRDEMNAAVHMSPTVRFSPLTDQLYYAEDSILKLEQHFKDK